MDNDDVTVEELASRIKTLESKVSFIERETGANMAQSYFEKFIESTAPDDANTELSEGNYGYHARVVGIDGDDAQAMEERIDRRDGYDYALTETSDGLGMEIWSTED